MAENLRLNDPSNDGTSRVRVALIEECEREEESCLYTSTSFYIWLRTLKLVRGTLWAIGATGSIVSASSILSEKQASPILMAGLALTGVVMPGIIKAIRLDSTIAEYAIAAAAFKNLQGEFRRAAKVWSNKPLLDFESEAKRVIKALNEARKPSLTPPEWCFRCAQKKIKRGDYEKEKNDR